MSAQRKWFRQFLLFACLATGWLCHAHQEALAQPAPVPVEVAEAETEVVPEESGSLLTTLVDMVRALDMWIIPFALATLIAVWFTAERLVVLRRGRVIPRPFVKRFLALLEDGELEAPQALEICEKNGSPVAQIFAHGVRKWGKPSVELEQAIIDGGERQVAALRKHLRVINGVATVTPLLGLLGTVCGMLISFNRIAEHGAMGNTEQLAAGIALALVTTAAGLIIAIPSLIAYMYLNGRVDALVMDMDLLSQRVVQCVSAEALVDRANRPRAVPSDTERTSRKKRAV